MNSISETTQIGQGTTFGESVMIGDNAVIGENCRIGSGVIIYPGTLIGSDVRIDESAVLGKPPMKAALSALTDERERPSLKVGNRCLIGVGAVIYEGTTLGEDLLIADLATIREDVTVGDKTIIGRGVAVENKCSIGARCKIETNTYICSLSNIADDCFVAPGVITTNDNFLGRTKERFKYHKGITMKRGARIGGGAVILPGIVINEDGVVGAGSVVTKDVPPGVIVAGNPARKLRDVPIEQLLENQ